MEMPVRVVETGVEIRSPVVLMGVPGPGLVGVIAVDYLVRSLKMEEAGFLDSPEFPPIVGVRDGVIQPIFRIFSKGGTYTVLSQVPLPPQLLMTSTTAVIEWLVPKRPKVLVLLGGVGGRKLGSEEIEVFAVYSSREASELGRSMGVRAMPNGFLSGFAAFLLRESARAGIPAIALLAQSYANYPDPGAAAVLIEKAAPLIGEEVDVGALLKESEEIRLKLRELMSETSRAMAEEAKAPTYIA
ncbi:MAG: hypothetical protein DRO06_00620 [Thermoproteota archaeon]|nr:MAG: hypothetical protein DRO06_00620 [Candidatus Korarchaeota archaeon]